jgi:hypothetical protein
VVVAMVRWIFNPHMQQDWHQQWWQWFGGSLTLTCTRSGIKVVAMVLLIFNLHMHQGLALTVVAMVL